MRSNLATRLLTALGAGPLILGLLFYGPGWAWYALVLAALGLAATEFFAMTHPEDRVARGIGVLSACGVSLGLYLGTEQPRVLLSITLGIPLVGMLVSLIRLGDIQTAGLRMMAGIAGPFYLGGLLTTLAFLRRDTGPAYVLLVLTVAWLADTGGYAFGRLWGRRKLYEAVSPRKTYAGFFGSLFAAVCSGALAHFVYLRELPLVDALLLGLVGGTLGQFGDLAESLLKRSTGIKDSGQVIPGHGGILDRVDSLLVVGAVVYAYTLWV